MTCAESTIIISSSNHTISCLYYSGAILRNISTWRYMTDPFAMRILLKERFARQKDTWNITEELRADRACYLVHAEFL